MRATTMRVRYDVGGGQPVRVNDRAVPQAFELQIEQPEEGRPEVILGFEVRDGVPQCRRAELCSTEDGREVLSSDLRGIKLEDLLEYALVSVAMVFQHRGEGDSGLTIMEPAEAEAERRGSLTTLRSVRREARRHVTDDVLREVARVYRENVDSNPTAAVAAFTGRAHRTAALYVKQAREAGFLGAATRGKAGEQS